jgi:lactoylglutathione lyase
MGAMQIEHLALWTRHLEDLLAFYATFFDAVPGPKYHNSNTDFESYFLTFAEGPRLELMQMPGIGPARPSDPQTVGIAHFAVSVGSQSAVDDLTRALRDAGVPVVGEPRWTGDGYYESVVLDPDGNRIEITI